MRKIVFIVTFIIVVVAAAVVLITRQNLQYSSDIESRVKAAYISNYTYGYYKDKPEDVEIIGYKDLGDSVHAIDLQLLNVGHGARYGVNIDRVVFEVKNNKPKIVTILPDNKLRMSNPSATKVLSKEIQQALEDWPLSPSIHENATTAFDFYSGDLPESSRTKLTDWFINATTDTRLSNMTIRQDSYKKSPEYPSTISFVLDIKSPKSSYRVTQLSYLKLQPPTYTLYLSCIEDGATDEDGPNCGGDVQL